jgi:hypothetical protein
MQCIKIQFVPHRKHITSPLQSPTGYCCLGKQPLFTVSTIRNTQIHYVGRMQSFYLMLKPVLHRVIATALYPQPDEFKGSDGDDNGFSYYHYYYLLRIR